MTPAVLDRPGFSTAQRSLDGGGTLEELLTSARARGAGGRPHRLPRVPRPR